MTITPTYVTPESAGVFSSEHAEEDAPARRQYGTLFAVVLEDGTELDVRTSNRDVIAWEKTKARHREWPTSDEAPIFASTFVIWAAAKRAGQTALGFDAFADAVIDFEKIAEEAADPTR